jgi:hypothetical protein
MYFIYFFLIKWIWFSLSCDYEEFYFMGYKAV